MFDDDDLHDDPTRSALGAARHRAVYWLPNLFTLGGLFAGFYSIIAAIHDRLHESLGNLTPDDMYHGRQREIFTHRTKIKRLRLERRKKEDLRTAA